jgi:chromosome segregation ATPase
MSIKITRPAILFSWFIALTAMVAAQQPPRRPMPTLTDETAAPVKPAPPAPADASSAAASPATDPAKPAAPAGQKAEGQNADSAQTTDEQQRELAEKDWNEKLSKARERVKDLERRADQAELEVNRLRNFQFSAEPRDAGTNAQINARVAELNELARRLRAEAKTAQEEVDALLAEGAEKNYKIAKLSPTTKTGAVNLEYYESRFAELQSELRDAMARAQVMQLRINALRFRINDNARTGDNFFLGRLRGELQEAEGGLEQAQLRMAAATGQLEELRRQARAAGVPLPEL